MRMSLGEPYITVTTLEQPGAGAGVGGHTF